MEFRRLVCMPFTYVMSKWGNVKTYVFLMCVHKLRSVVMKVSCIVQFLFLNNIYQLHKLLSGKM